MRLKFDFKKKCYVIYEWTDIHNHPFVDLDKVHLMPMYRQIQPEQKAMIDFHIKSGLSIRSTYDALIEYYGTVEDMGFLRSDLKNYASSRKRMQMFPDDAIVMQRWFREQVIKQPSFFMICKLMIQGKLPIWADSVMISDYLKFGDFLSFDTTYMTNDTSRPLGVFVRFNHHKTTVIFGAALMYNETALSFKWGFEALMRCMGNRFPKTIMTDQAPTIALVIRDIFPGVFHGLCSWHIDQNARKRLGVESDSLFLECFNHLIKYVDSEAEFEFGWNNMLNLCFQRNPTSENSWLSFIYTFRKQWSSAWVKDHFTVGKTTTQLSEQFNAFARHYLHPEMEISELMRRFKSLVDDLRFNEKTRDYYMQNTILENNFKKCNFMMQASKLFTPHVFKIIHEEYDCGMEYLLEETIYVPSDIDYSFEETLKALSGSAKVIILRRWENKGLEDEALIEKEVVHLDIQRRFIKYSCRFFENWWLPCRHVLRVMEVYGVFDITGFCTSLPDQFIKSRWTRSCAKPCSVLPNEASKAPTTRGQRYTRIFNLMVFVATRICYSEEAYNYFMNHIYEGSNESYKLLDASQSSSMLTRSDCSSYVGEEEEEYYSIKYKNQNKDIDGSKVRLMSNLEKRHLKWKQELKRKISMESVNLS